MSKIATSIEQAFDLFNLPENVVEIWKDISGYEGLYQVSNKGRVKSTGGRHGGFSCDIILKSHFQKGYHKLRLYKDNTWHNFLVHRLIAIAFIPNPYNKPYINHINGNRSDNRIENLEWCTQKENIVHAHLLNLCPIRNGESIGTSKLKEFEAIEVYKLYHSKKYTNAQIAKMFNIDPTNVSTIGLRKSWKHLQMPPISD